MGHDDRELRAQRFAQPPHNLGIRVRILFRHHGAVQRQKQTVKMRHCPDLCDQVAGQDVERFIRNRSLRRSRCHQHGDQFQPVFAPTFDVAADFVVAARPFRQRFRPRCGPTRREIGKFGLGRVKRVGLVHDAADGDNRAALLRRDHKG